MTKQIVLVDGKDIDTLTTDQLSQMMSDNDMALRKENDALSIIDTKVFEIRQSINTLEGEKLVVMRDRQQHIAKVKDLKTLGEILKMKYWNTKNA